MEQESRPTPDYAMERLGEIIRASANQLASGAKFVAGSVDVTREAMGGYTDHLCKSLDTFRDSMDKSSRTMARLTIALVFLTLVYVIATVAQVLGWKPW